MRLAYQKLQTTLPILSLGQDYQKSPQLSTRTANII